MKRDNKNAFKTRPSGFRLFHCGPRLSDYILLDNSQKKRLFHPILPFASIGIIINEDIDDASGTFGVRVDLPHPDYQVKAGLNCRVLIMTQ